MDLYLVRHAVAHKRDYERWPNDAERPLTPDGEKGFRVVARGLEAVLSPPETILSSPYVRAWRTAEILADQSGWPAPRVLPALEPDVPPEKVTLALSSYAENDPLVLVGHRPSMHELASYLLVGEDDTLNIGLKKGGAACIRFDGPPEVASGKLRWLLTPRILGALGSS